MASLSSWMERLIQCAYPLHVIIGNWDYKKKKEINKT